MSSTHDSSTTLSIMALDIYIPVSIILYVTGIAPIFFILLLSFVLGGVIICTIWECIKVFLPCQDMQEHGRK